MEKKSIKDINKKLLKAVFLIMSLVIFPAALIILNTEAKPSVILAEAETECPYKANYVVVTRIPGNTINIRKGEGTSHDIVGSLKDRDRIYVSANKPYGWSEIYYNINYNYNTKHWDHATGYISKEYLVAEKYLNDYLNSLNEELNNATIGTPVSERKGECYADGVSVRTQPGTTYTKIDTIYSGTKCTIIGEKTYSSTDKWFRIKYNSKTGWVTSKYILDSGNKIGKVTATTLNVRNGAGTSYKKVFVLKSGAKFNIISTKTGWYKINYKGSTGWVSSDYVKIISI